MTTTTNTTSDLPKRQRIRRKEDQSILFLFCLAALAMVYHTHCIHKAAVKLSSPRNDLYLKSFQAPRIQNESTNRKFTMGQVLKAAVAEKKEKTAKEQTARQKQQQHTGQPIPLNELITMYPDKKELLEILRNAGITELDDETALKLPTWSDVTALYGTKPILYGLDQCKVFRQRIDLSKRHLGIAGTFNTGTNLLFELLEANCRGPRGRMADYQVPWGKHNPPLNETIRLQRKPKGYEAFDDINEIFPIVTIRNPYFWMKAICKKPYAVRWLHDNKLHCPNLIPTKQELQNNRRFQPNHPVRVGVWYQKTWVIHHDSLAHMWNDIHELYKNQVSFPRVMVRMEDLIFFAPQIISELCTTCVGGTLLDPQKFQYATTSAKPKHFKNGATGTGLVDAMIMYGNASLQYEGYTRDDLMFANKTLSKELMETFGYQYVQI